ncbi:MAG: glutamine--fructose-6-phosphate transaminase (isomerizing) [Bryobacterales bacterium]|nr:glutamine--fructose-6-phosphate transaminase (isomerizing) [Bryobacterales bacterium]
MCGIVGYIGTRSAVPIILDGLKRLEYRGYDSAGLAVLNGHGQIEIRRASGKLRNLEECLRDNPVAGSYGIGHTRWATHGRPTEENAHPHCDSKGNVVVVHNGIVENYLSLKHKLESQGHRFKSETDTEVIAHLIERFLPERSLEEAVRMAVKQLSGVFALGIVSLSDPKKIVAARSGPPVVVGLGEGEYFLASDVPAILSHTRDMIFLDDGDLAVMTAEGVRLTDFEGRPIKRNVSHILWDPIMAEKGGYKHFMLKEIFEQPRAVRDTMLGRVSQETGHLFLNEVNLSPQEFAEFKQVKIVACGTSWHAGLAGKFMIEKLARVPVEVDYGSEFRYRDPIVDSSVLTVVISQSGETADTLAAQREAKQKGSKTLAICNVVGSMITREAVGSLLTHAGPEIGVASTKAFTGQLTAMGLLAMYLAQCRNMDPEMLQAAAQELLRIPGKMEVVLANDTHFEDVARHLFRVTDFLFLGRGIHYPIALEGALKLKEISYIHAEGYPAGEMKHGPNALIDENLPVVVLATRDPSSEESRVRYEKTLSNIQEVNARGGIVVAVACQPDVDEVKKVAQYVISIPPTDEIWLPILEIVPLQLLAYHIAVRRGCDVDQPRNLAKSVTVE